MKCNWYIFEWKEEIHTYPRMLYIEKLGKGGNHLLRKKKKKKNLQ